MNLLSVTPSRHLAVPDVSSRTIINSAVWKWSDDKINQVNFIFSVILRTFNPADYAEPAQTEESYGGGSTWNNTGSTELEEGTSKNIY